MFNKNRVLLAAQHTAQPEACSDNEFEPVLILSLNNTHTQLGHRGKGNSGRYQVLVALKTMEKVVDKMYGLRLRDDPELMSAIPKQLTCPGHLPQSGVLRKEGRGRLVRGS